MKKTILISFLAVIILASCAKEEVKPDCELRKYFNLEITNGSNDTYMVYINNNYINDISGKKKQNYTVPAGFAEIYVKQKDGYVLFATEKTYENTANACDNKYLIIP